ncbi:MAG: MMPL family transporter, partial [Pseudomonadota bacterium]
MTEENKSVFSTMTAGRLSKHPTLVLLAVLVLVVVSLIYSATSLRINADTTDMIAADVPFRQNHLALQAAFPAFKETVVAVIDGDSAEASEAAATALASAMIEEDGLFDQVDVLGTDPFFKRHGLLYLDLDELTKLSDSLAEAQPLLAALAADPNLKGLSGFLTLALEAEEQDSSSERLDRLFDQMVVVVDAAREGRQQRLSWTELLDQERLRGNKRQLLIAEPAIDYGSLAPAATAIEATRKLARNAGINVDGGPTMRLTGSAVIEHEELQTVSSGAVWAGVLATAGVTLLLVFGLGSIRLIAATLLTLLAGLIMTGGLATLMIGQLNLISVTFAVLFVGLGVDFGIHLCLRYKEEIRRGQSHGGALDKAVYALSRPLSLSAICAGLGFIAFVPTDYRGLAELGIISATGMAVAWSTSLVLLPALLHLLPLKASQRAPIATTVGTAWTERYASTILGLAIIAAVCAVPMLPRVSFDFNPLNLKDPNSESVAT